MEENPKYYTPDISEFHVGFEYEFRREGEDWSNNESDEIICDFENDNILLLKDDIKNKRVRVKYLDKDDFISLGLIDRNDRGMAENNGYHFTKGPHITVKFWYIKHDFNSGQRVSISNDGLETNFYLKNKSELQRLMKQLNLK